MTWVFENTISCDKTQIELSYVFLILLEFSKAFKRHGE